MVILFQEGIPGIFFPALEARGVRIETFTADTLAAQAVFQKNPGAQAIFFRANFPFGSRQLAEIPQLNTAVLVSTGTDNVDEEAVRARGVRFVSGEGANAEAVFDYVIQALCFGGCDFKTHSIGIVGRGRIGGRIQKFLQRLNVETHYYDPFLPEPGSLHSVLQCDYVSFHVPLTRTGPHKTYGMLDEKYFSTVQNKIRIIQTCRGEIWNQEWYHSIANHPHIELLAQDVYPAEPPAVADLLHARFSTPHIAGYSTQGRLGGIVRGIEALFPDFRAADLFPKGRAWFLDEEAAAFAANPVRFSAMRDNYFWRREFHEYDALERRAFRQKFPGLSNEFYSCLFREN